jgi:trans-aconitate methyltransferase
MQLGVRPELLIDAGCNVDAWETTYIHQLTG